MSDEVQDGDLFESETDVRCPNCGTIHHAGNLSQFRVRKRWHWGCVSCKYLFRTRKKIIYVSEAVCLRVFSTRHNHG